jgi:hypothetical protein
VRVWHCNKLPKPPSSRPNASLHRKFFAVEVRALEIARLRCRRSVQGLVRRRLPPVIPADTYTAASKAVSEHSQRCCSGMLAPEFGSCQRVCDGSIHMDESSLPNLLTWRLLAAARGESPPLHASRPRKQVRTPSIPRSPGLPGLQRLKPCGHAKTLADAAALHGAVVSVFRLAVEDRMRP